MLPAQSSRRISEWELREKDHALRSALENRLTPPGSEPHLTEVFAKIADHVPLTIEEFVPAGKSDMEHVVFNVDPQGP
jgi:hypothetical protein